MYGTHVKPSVSSSVKGRNKRYNNLFKMKRDVVGYIVVLWIDPGPKSKNIYQMNSNCPLYFKHTLLYALPVFGSFGLQGNINQTLWHVETAKANSNIAPPLNNKKHLPKVCQKHVYLLIVVGTSSNRVFGLPLK